jgi:hypothetical protein
MYDRDYVKTLERELELGSDNRFEGWRLSSDRANSANKNHSQQGERSSEKPADE